MVVIIYIVDKLILHSEESFSWHPGDGEAGGGLSLHRAFP